jgi:hypothetical protein
MSPSKNVLVDAALILTGAGLSILFISTDGNGQNPVPVAGGIMLLVLATGVISFLLARIVRTLPLAIIASAIITDLLFVVYGLNQMNSSRDPYAGEMALLFPIVFVFDTGPTVLLCSIGFGRLASRFWQRRIRPVSLTAPSPAPVSQPDHHHNTEK